MDITQKVSFFSFNQGRFKRIIALGSLSFFILLNYSLLRSLKDSYIIYTIGQEAVGFLKLYFVVPTTLMFVFVYARLSITLSQKSIFFIFSSFFFCILFILFFIIFPNRENFIADPEYITLLIIKYPHLKWFIKISSCWDYSIFYVFAEMWGAVMYTVLFWVLANNISISKEEAKKTYPIIAIIANLAMPAGGVITNIIGKNLPLLFANILLFNIFTIILYKIIVNNFVNVSIKTYNKKNKQNLKDVFKVIISAKPLWLMFILIVAFGSSMNIVESFWKSNLSKKYTSIEENISILSNIQSFQGILSIILILFNALLLKRYSWKTVSMIIPCFILLTGGVFFLLIIFIEDLEPILLKFFVLSPLSIALFFGMAQTIFAKSFKYALFDPAKEMMYVSLSEDLRTKGKAAVDLLGGRFGKSGAGLIESFLFILIPTASFMNTVSFFAVSFFIIIIIWIVSVHFLNIELKKIDAQ